MRFCGTPENSGIVFAASACERRKRRNRTPMPYQHSSTLVLVAHSGVPVGKPGEPPRQGALTRGKTTDKIKKGIKDAAGAVKQVAEKGKDAATRAVDKGKDTAVRGAEKVQKKTDQAAEKVKNA